MTDLNHCPFDEEAAMDAAREQNAASLHDALRREHDERLRGRKQDARVERGMVEIDEEITRDLKRLQK